eukprot:comp9439_c0_seq1/m.4496 comp9439_c0_seq1/g.4496  ORF comp9439_c0_seq1/g.4496 comp9439_c0_seq1/m.4496 type:complete len:223 (-) comp9439_c0_seq1:24-692(-)
MAANENLAPAVITRLSRDVKKLMTTHLEGIKVEIKEDDMTDIFAVIDGPEDTPYAGGKFRMRLVLGNDFPSSPPKGFFVTKIFHPNVNTQTGEICVNTLKKDWKPDMGIQHILLTVKCLLIVPNPESALNDEAGRLLLEDYDGYARHARLMTEIHAKPRTQAPSPTKNPTRLNVETSSSGVGQENGGTEENEERHGGVKRAAEKAPKVDKAKVDKKKGIRRL